MKVIEGDFGFDFKTGQVAEKVEQLPEPEILKTRVSKQEHDYIRQIIECLQSRYEHSRVDPIFFRSELQDWLAALNEVHDCAHVVATYVASFATEDAAPSQAAIDEFYQGWEWRRVRYEFIKDRKRKCDCCGRTPAQDGLRIVVDHIRPIRRFWSRRLDPSNLQLLCDDCNQGKGSQDTTDWSAANTIEPPAQSQWQTEEAERLEWLAKAKEVGIKVDGRWKLEKMRKEIMKELERRVRLAEMDEPVVSIPPEFKIN